MSAIEVWSNEDAIKHIKFQLNWYKQKTGHINIDVRALEKAIVALEQKEKQLYVAYEQGQYDSLDYYGFFYTDEEAVKELTKVIGESFTSGNEYRFFKLDFSKKGIDTSLPVKEVLERVGEQK